jgi:hypothetical protein
MKKSIFALLTAVGTLTLFSFTTKHETQLVKNENGTYTITPAVKMSEADIKLLMDNTVQTELGAFIFSKLITRQTKDAKTESTTVSTVAQDIVIAEELDPAQLTQAQKDVVSYILAKY